MDPVAATGLRERKKAKTRDALVRSALRQFHERGFDHVTVDDIAEDCEVSPRTFFRYFSSKEEVLFGDVDGARQRLLDSLAEQPAEASVLEALRAAVLTVVVEYEHERDLKLLRQQVLRATPALQGRAIERHHGWVVEVTEAVRRSGRAERMSELDLRLAVATSATALGVATDLWVEDGGRGDLTALLSTVLDRLRDGLDA